MSIPLAKEDRACWDHSPPAGLEGWDQEALDWKVKGGLYKVFISPDGSKFYSAAKAIENGFSPSENLDGRKSRKTKGQEAKKSKKWYVFRTVLKLIVVASNLAWALLFWGST